MTTRTPTPRARVRRRRDHRGASSSLIAAIVAPMLLVLVGLVVDGGGQLAAARQAEAAAAQSARSGVIAGTTGALTGRPNASVARTAAEDHLRRAGVAGSVVVTAQQVTVHTTVDHSTVFLGLIGIHTLTGTGTASARLVSPPPG